MRYDKFEIVFGVNPGYNHANEAATPLQAVAAAWDAEALTASQYIPVVLTSGKCVYKAEWGCPPGGEDVVIASGTRNPKFSEDDWHWQHAVQGIARRVKQALQQATITISFSKADVDYIVD
jgi:hypothetical protein